MNSASAWEAYKESKRDDLDLITGLQLVDSEVRLFILEGHAAAGTNGMAKLHALLERQDRRVLRDQHGRDARLERRREAQRRVARLDEDAHERHVPLQHFVVLILDHLAARRAALYVSGRLGACLSLNSGPTTVLTFGL